MGNSSIGPTANRLEGRRLGSQLTTVEDEKIHRVLEIVDSLGLRGEADAVIAPIRARLAKLRPKRTLNCARLLFTPFDPLMVSPADWIPGSSTIPRTALTALARQVQAKLATEYTDLDLASATYRCSDDLVSILAAGRKVWPRAAEILRCPMAVPSDWRDETGLRDQDFTALRTALQALLPLAAPLLQIAVDARDGRNPEPEQLLEMLEATAQAGAQVTTMFVAMGLHWLPCTGMFIKVADRFVGGLANPAVAATIDNAVEVVLSGIERSSLFGARLASAAGEIRRVAVLMEDLVTCSANKPSRRNRIEQVRQDVDTACRESFGAEINDLFLEPCAGIATADGAAIDAFEDTARTLRRYESVARKFGGAEFYDQQLKLAAQAVSPRPDESTKTRVSRIRLIEILRGADVAAAAMRDSL
jgi:hypothetical protein